MTIYVIAEESVIYSDETKVSYNMVDILNKHGFSATVLHWSKGYRYALYPNNTKVSYLSDITLKKTDYILIPEWCAHNFTHFKSKAKLVVHCQVPHFMFNNHPLTKESFTTLYTSTRLLGVMVNNDLSARYFKYVFPHQKVFRINNCVDSKIFQYHTHKRKQICFFLEQKRRLYRDALEVINILKFRGVLKDFSVVPIQNAAQEQIAQIFKESLIFLSFRYPQGFGLTAAEAMACGCIVIGYHGIGGKEFFSPKFSYPIEVGYLQKFSQTVESAINKFRKSPQSVLKFGKKASKFIATQYTQEKSEKAIIQCWKNIITL